MPNSFLITGESSSTEMGSVCMVAINQAKKGESFKNFTLKVLGCLKIRQKYCPSSLIEMNRAFFKWSGYESVKISDSGLKTQGSLKKSEVLS